MQRVKRMLILGSSKGLGKELYRMFNDINYEVIGVSRSESQYTDIVCDLSDKKQVRLLVSKIQKSIPNNVIFNAGQGSSKQETPSQRTAELRSQNFFTAKYFIDEIMNDENNLSNIDNLIFINSICALENVICSEEYQSSKRELLHYVRSISNQLIRNKVRVNSLLPGNIMHENSVWKKKFDKASDEKEFLKKTMPFGDWIYPRDIFNTINFLIDNKNLVGNEIILDGGQSQFSPD